MLARNKISILLAVGTVSLFFSSTETHAAGIQVATMARVEGDVKLFSKPGPNAKKEAGATTQVLHDGVYYNVRAAKIGDPLELGNLVLSGPKSKARLIYKNGDSITVSENSMLRVRWKADSESQPVFEVMGGAIRGQFMKGGPRANSEVKTTSVVMGVRGTDFHMAKNGEGSRVSIMRGEVDLNAPGSKAKPVKVASGFSATVAAPPPPPKAPAPDKTGSNPAAAPPPPVSLLKVIAVEKTPSQEILAIQKQTTVRRPTAAEAPSAQLKELESKSVDVALEDIKAEDPVLYEKLKKSATSIEDADKVTTIATKEVYRKAVQAETAKKPEDLKDLDDVYDKFFKD